MPTSRQKHCGIALPLFGFLTLSKMGEARFTLGVGKEMLLKNTYPCSIATHDDFIDRSSLSGTEDDKRTAIKKAIKAHYNDHYDKQVLENDGTRAKLDLLVGTKRPDLSWNMQSYNRMYSFWAGKVLLTLISS